MSQQIQQTKKGYCKNIYCDTLLVGFDKGKEFCIRCRNSSWKELKWLCQVCQYTVLSSTTSSLNKKICDGCLKAHTRKRNRRSYRMRVNKLTLQDPVFLKQFIIDYKFRTFINSLDSSEKTYYSKGVCKYCDEPIKINFRKKKREFCSKSCKVANNRSLIRFINKSLQSINIMLNEIHMKTDGEIGIS